MVVPGAVTPHRNAEGAIAAYAALPADVRRSHRLVLGAGRRTRQHLRLRRIARAAGVSVVTTAATIPGCLRHASVALFPTFWDGYAPGAAEARSFGVPIAASTTSAAAEIAVDPELLFDPRDAPSLGRALVRALARTDVRPAPDPPADAGAALRAIWERVAAGREVLQPPNLLPSERIVASMASSVSQHQPLLRDAATARRILRQMVLIRRFEERTEEQYTRARIGGYCHLAIGEEAANVGAIEPLGESDYLFTSYRDHGAALAVGSEPAGVMAELFGKATGVAGGYGGSMHLLDVERRFLGG